MNDNRASRWLAIFTGVVAAGGALYVLLKEDIATGRWSDSFVLVPVTVVIAITAGHLVTDALRARRLISALLFALAFCLATALTVWMSVGKQATTAKAAAEAAQAIADARKSKMDAIDKARTRLDEAEGKADKERSTGCKGRCQDWEQRAADLRAEIAQLEQELADLPLPPSVNAGEKHVAKAITFPFGADQAFVEALLTLYKPFTFAALFEVTAIAAFGYGFAPARRGEAAPAARSLPAIPDPEPEPGDEVIDWIKAFEARHGRKPQIPELQRVYPLPKTTAWRRIRAA